MRLIEVIVSLFILSCLLSGVGTMQIFTLHQTQAAYYYDVALNQINNINEKLNVIKNDPINNILLLWNQENQQVLPQGRGIIQGEYPFFNITIFWGNQSANTPLCQQNKIGLSGCYGEHIKVTS